MLPKIPVGETAQAESEDEEGGEQCLDSVISEAKPRCALPLDDLGVVDRVERVFSDRAVVADSLDVQETSVGLEADLPECGKVLKPSAEVWPSTASAVNDVEQSTEGGVSVRALALHLAAQSCHTPRRSEAQPR